VCYNLYRSVALTATKIPIHRVPKKKDTKLMAVTLLIINRFLKFFTDRLSSKVAAKYLLKIPLHLLCVATLPCKTIMTENERQSPTNAVINDKLQGTVVAYLRCGGLSITKLRKVFC